MSSEHIKSTGYNVGISCMVITTCIYDLHPWHKVILYSTQSIGFVSVLQAALKLIQPGYESCGSYPGSELICTHQVFWSMH